MGYFVPFISIFGLMKATPQFLQPLGKEDFIGQNILTGLCNENQPFIYDGEIIGYPFDLKGLIDRHGKAIIPNCLGFYHLFFRGRIVYIGMSRKIRGRLLSHLRDENMIFDSVLWFCADMYYENPTVEKILIIESNLIKRFMPPLNLAHANCG